MSAKHLFYFSDTLAKHSLIIKSGKDFKDTIRVSYVIKTELENKISYKEKKTNTLTSKEEFTLEFNQFIKEIDTSLIEIVVDSVQINASFKVNKNFLTIVP
jgi:L-cysteine desulfidase